MRSLDLLLITNPHGPLVLLLAGPDGWGLPHNAPLKDHWWQVVAPVNQAAASLGLATTTLRCLEIVDDEQADEAGFYYALELRAEPGPAQPGRRWVARADLADLTLASAEQRAIIEAWLSGPLSQVPWYNPGFAASAEAWALDKLARLGQPASGPMEQQRSWERSALWRVPTAEGPAYLKAVPPVFSHEPALSAALAGWLPGQSAPVLAHDSQAGLLLLGDGGAQSLADTPDPATWAAAMERLAVLQISLAERGDELLALGTPDRRLAHMPAAIDALLADEAALRRSPAGLSDTEIAALRARGPALKAACAELAGGGLPDSLEHGDFFPTQVLIGPSGPVFIDWSDSSISHPFFSMAFLGEPDAPMPAIDQPQRFVRAAYLGPWKRFSTPHAQLERLFDLALLLAPMHQALIYHRSILPAMEQGWEMERMPPYYLRRLLS